jgi:hypothetical protein
MAGQLGEDVQVRGWLRWVFVRSLRPSDSGGPPRASPRSTGSVARRPVEMGEHDIASVVWHRRSHIIEVIYVSDNPDRMEATWAVAAELARDARLGLLSDSKDTVRWVRGSLTSHSAEEPETTTRDVESRKIAAGQQGG